MIEKGPVQAIVLLALAGAALWFLFLMVHRFYYSWPKPFERGGVRYMWERDPDCPLWVRQFTRGRFRHPDGTLVTDPELVRALQQSWIIEHRQHHEDHG